MLSTPFLWAWHGALPPLSPMSSATTMGSSRGHNRGRREGEGGAGDGSGGSSGGGGGGGGSGGGGRVGSLSSSVGTQRIRLNMFDNFRESKLQVWGVRYACCMYVVSLVHVVRCACDGVCG
jgi:hypothetical protein